MTALQWLRDSIQHDPVFAYALLAAALLALVSLGSAVARRDVAALARPRILLRVVGAVVATFGLVALAAAVDPRWQLPLRGLAPTPLALVALAYGPGVGLATAALSAGLQAGGGLPGWPQAVGALELTVLGWLAIYPSPRSNRWAGPFDLLLAHALAWGTGGLALMAAHGAAVTPAALWNEQRPLLPGVLAGALLLAAVPPAAYRRAFPHSRIAPDDAAAAAAGSDADGIGEEPWPNAARSRDPMKLTYPELPRVLARGRRRRELEPLPSSFEDDELA